MSRITSVSALALALGLVSAPLAFAEEGSKATPTDPSIEVKAAATQAPAKAGYGHMKHAAAEKVDLNTATREELEKLPGIDPATAEKIVAGRPLKSKKDLLARGIVSKAEFSKISAQVFAKPSKAAK